MSGSWLRGPDATASAGRYGGLAISPPLRVTIAIIVGGDRSSVRNRELPSPKTAFTPPGWNEYGSSQLVQFITHWPPLVTPDAGTRPVVSV